MTVRYLSSSTLVCASVLACSAASDTETPSDSASESASEATSQEIARPLDFASCDRGALETDFVAAPLAGPSVQDGALPPGEYLVSTTYLELDPAPEPQQLFGELITPIVADLPTRPGLLALSLGQSEACSVARTLAVWQDDMAMLSFVVSPAHSAAMARVTDLSRGGSIVTHWRGDEASVDWASAARRIGEDEGPFY